MKYIYTGTNMEVGDSVKKRAEKKLARLEKFLPNETEINIICTEIKFNVRVEVTAQLHKRILRAEVTESDINVCFDSVADILEKQIIKYKSRLRERWRRGAATNEEITFSENITEQAGAEEIIIHKTKKFALKP
ncbi:MAG: ribosome-associated translation inhibitor RaiA, partial [Defluviitaleaceae bacterium]|nr:ribosome-associated translation inhibitor RaiA [Defluviitaleaceae bacterium]